MRVETQLGFLRHQTKQPNPIHGKNTNGVSFHQVMVSSRAILEA
jgi:hypothetical protein